MVIAPFRASTQSLTPEQVRGATPATLLAIRAVPTAKVTATHDPAPVLYSYDHQQGGSGLQGVLALVQGAQFLCPMSALPNDVALARQHWSSKREQFAPVLALYDANASADEASFRTAHATEDQFRIEPIPEAELFSKLNSALTDLPLTVIAGQEWVETANGQPVMTLLVNQRTCTPELQPLHRTIRWKPGWHPGDMVRLGREHFFFHDISRTMPQLDGTGPHYSEPVASEFLRPKVAGEVVFLAVTPRHTFRIHSLPGWADTVLSHRSPEERSISTVQLHDILIPDGLRLPPDSAAEQVSYTSNMDEAVARVIRGDADVAFLMNAPSVEQIVAVACAGGSIPPRSFRPRLEPVPGAITYAF
jgi:hypothetical protein